MRVSKSIKITAVDALEPPTVYVEVPVTDAQPLLQTPVAMGLPESLRQEYASKRLRLLREAKQRLKGVLLERDTWNVLWQIDGKRSVAEIADNLMLPLGEVIYHTESLRLMAIICAVDAVYLPDFVQEKTKRKTDHPQRRKSDEED